MDETWSKDRSERNESEGRIISAFRDKELFAAIEQVMLDARESYLSSMMSGAARNAMDDMAILMDRRGRVRVLDEMLARFRQLRARSEIEMPRA